MKTLPQIVSPPFWYMGFWILVFIPCFWLVGYFAIKWANIAADKVTGK